MSSISKIKKAFGLTLVFLSTSAFAQDSKTINPVLHKEILYQNCRLGNCWQGAFENIRSNLKDSTKAIDSYLSEYQRQINETFHYDNEQEKSEELALRHRLTLVKKYLNECEGDLNQGVNAPRHLIILGHEFAGDGKNFTLTALAAKEEILKKICGPKPPDGIVTEAYEYCSQSIVIKDDRNKQELANYLQLVGPKSIESVTYVGHGIKNALVMGPKNLLLPKDWDKDLKITKDQWIEQNTGMLYTKDLEALSPQLKRIMKPKAEVKFLACHVGQEFGPKMKKIVCTSTVEASMHGMHFQYQDADGNWHTEMFTEPVPLTAQKIRLVPDKEGEYREMKSSRDDGSKIKATPVAPAPTSITPQDRATRDIVLRVSINSADNAMVSKGKKFVQFDHNDRYLLQELMKDKISNRDLKDQSFGLSSFQKMATEAMNKSTSDEEKKRWALLKKKIEECVEESVRLYY